MRLHAIHDHEGDGYQDLRLAQRSPMPATFLPASSGQASVVRASRVPYSLRPMEQRPHIPPALRPYAEDARALGARLTRDALGPGRSSSRLDDLARRLQRELDRMVQEKFDSLLGDGEVACSAGCDHCCRTLPVMVSPIEVFTLVHRVRDRGAASATAEAPASGPFPPCPLLGPGGLCTVYSSRPLACRGCVSADVEACAAGDGNQLVPRSTVHQLGAAAMMKGVCDTLDSLGLISTLVELRAAVALALRDSEAERGWFRGEDVFCGVD
jgi:hypothetical protein